MSLSILHTRRSDSAIVRLFEDSAEDATRTRRTGYRTDNSQAKENERANRAAASGYRLLGN